QLLAVRRPRLRPEVPRRGQALRVLAVARDEEDAFVLSLDRARPPVRRDQSYEALRQVSRMRSRGVGDPDVGVGRRLALGRRQLTADVDEVPFGGRRSLRAAAVSAACGRGHQQHDGPQRPDPGPRQPGRDRTHGYDWGAEPPVPSFVMDLRETTRPVLHPLVEELLADERLTPLPDALPPPAP